MTQPRIDVGMYVVAKPPLGTVEAIVNTARDTRLDSVFIWDHIQDFYPRAAWDEALGWLPSQSPSPHDWYEFQTLLGYLAAKAPDMQLGVGVTEPIRRHPVLLAQAMLTLAHLSNRPPILGIGSGERLNTEPYGLALSQPVSKLEEALQIIRRCFTSQEPFDFHGEHFHLDGAVLDLQVPEGNAPQIWIAAHGPRMLRLTGQYGDGWYPFAILSPDDYAGRLDVIHTAAKQAGRDPDAITPAMHPLVIVAPTEAQAREMLAAKSVRYFGLLFPDEVWQLFGLAHPMGEGFQGYLDLIPEAYDRQTIDAAIDAVPSGMIEGLMWGTPEQVASKLQAYGEAGLRHVVPVFLSATVSQEAATFSVQALGEIAQQLRDGR